MALNNVPVPGQSLGASRDLINQNFSVIDTAFTVNHVPYNDGSGLQGKHKVVQFPVQSAIPSLTVGDITMYNKLPASPYPQTGVNELFIVKADGTTTPITARAASTNGWSYLPSGILLKWGTTTSINGSLPFAYLFPVGSSIPVFNNVFSVQLTVVDDNPNYATSVAVQTGTMAVTGFSVVYTGTPPSSTVVTYLAIGN